MAVGIEEGKEIGTFLAKGRQAFVFAGVFSLVVNLLMLVPALYMLQVYDRVLTSRNVNTLIALSLLVVGLYALLALIEWIRALLVANAGVELDAVLSPRLFDAYLQHRARIGNASGDAAFSDAAVVRNFLAGSGLFALFDAPWAPIFIAVIYIMHPALAAVTVVGALLLVALAWLGQRLTQKASDEAATLQGVVTQAALGYGRNHEAVLAMGMRGALRQRWLERQDKLVALLTQVARRAGLIASASRFIRLAQQAAILGVGAWLVIEGHTSPGVMIAASILMTRALAPLDQAISSWRQYQAARASYRRLGRLLTQVPPDAEKLSLPEPTGDVTIEAVTVVPPGSTKPVLADIDFRIKPGMAVGVVGPSGSGKSCLARALTGVWMPARGTVRLDGASLADWEADALGRHVGYLPQSIELLEGSVADNIARFARQEPAKIVAAAKVAGVHEMVLKLPKGYQTPVGPDGASLSGGQRQRLALARAVYGQPRLVVLDEPNSNLDDEGEQALMRALAEMKAWGATVIIITHRRPVLAATDGLVVLKEGRLQVYGPTAAVLKQLAGPAMVAASTKAAA